MVWTGTGIRALGLFGRNFYLYLNFNGIPMYHALQFPYIITKLQFPYIIQNAKDQLPQV